MNDKTFWIDVGDGLSFGVPVNEDGTVDLMDSEGRFVWEPEGYSFFAFIPKKCRNGKIRWLCWLERHQNNTFTKSRSS